MADNLAKSAAELDAIDAARISEIDAILKTLRPEPGWGVPSSAIAPALIFILEDLKKVKLHG